MSEKSYRAALERLKAAYDLLGPFAGTCGICGNCLDRRHRWADPIVWLVASDPLGDGVDEAVSEHLSHLGAVEGCETAWRVTVAALAVEVERRKTRLTFERAFEIEREVWEATREAWEAGAKHG